MSHIVQIQTQVKDQQAVELACHRLKLPAPNYGTFQIYNTEATGLKVELPDWRYPVVCQLETGDVQYDNYQGSWGAESYLHQFLQAYAVEKSLLEARKQGYSATEEYLTDGTIKVLVTLAA
jgi:hypothetical protein